MINELHLASCIIGLLHHPSSNNPIQDFFSETSKNLYFISANNLMSNIFPFRKCIFSQTCSLLLKSTACTSQNSLFEPFCLHKGFPFRIFFRNPVHWVNKKLYFVFFGVITQ